MKSLAALVVILWFMVLANLMAVQTVSDKPLMTGGEMSLADRLYVVDVEATGAAKDKAAALSQLITFFGPTITTSASNLTSGTIPDARFPATLPALNGSALTALNASEITSGLLPNARLDADLAAIAALTTTTTGRSLLSAADEAAIRSIAGLGTAATNDHGNQPNMIPRWASSAYGGTSLTWTSELGGTISVYSQEAFTDTINILWPLTGGILLTDNSQLDAGKLTVITGNLPAISGANLTALNASNISSGTVAAARLPSSGISASALTVGTLPEARLPASGVTAGSYTAANVTVDAFGRVTGISSSSNGLIIGATGISGGTGGRFLMSGSTLVELTPGAGVVTWLGAPSLANLNAATTDADAASLNGNTYDAAQIIRLSGLGTTITSGLMLENSTAAASGAQQVSGALTLRGRGWKTNATAASQTVDFVNDVLPVQGAAAPTGLWRVGYAVNGATPLSVMELDSVGSLYLPNGSAGATMGKAIEYSAGSMKFAPAGTTAQIGTSGSPMAVGFLYAAGSFTSGSITSDGPGNLAQRGYFSPTTAQEYSIYNTDNGSNDELAKIGWRSTSNTLVIETAKTGTGTVRGIVIRVGGVDVITISSTGKVTLNGLQTSPGATGEIYSNSGVLTLSP